MTHSKLTIFLFTIIAITMRIQLFSQCADKPELSFGNDGFSICSGMSGFKLVGEVADIPFGTSWEYRFSFSGNPLNGWGANTFLQITNPVQEGNYYFEARQIGDPSCITSTAAFFAYFEPARDTLFI